MIQQRLQIGKQEKENELKRAYEELDKLKISIKDKEGMTVTNEEAIKNKLKKEYALQHQKNLNDITLKMKNDSINEINTMKTKHMNEMKNLMKESKSALINVSIYSNFYSGQLVGHYFTDFYLILLF